MSGFFSSVTSFFSSWDSSTWKLGSNFFHSWDDKGCKNTSVDVFGCDKYGDKWDKYCDNKPNYQSLCVDFGEESVYNKVSADGKTMSLTGLTLTAIGGDITHFDVNDVAGLGILSASDDPSIIFTAEIDHYNNDAEHVVLNFDQAQSSVTLILQQLYMEKQFNGPILAPEMADVKITFTDGSVITKVYEAVQTSRPGELAITLKSSDFGGKMIASIDLCPDDALAPQRADLPDVLKDSYNATHPYSEFILKDVCYVANTSRDGHCDTQCGTWFKDTFYASGGDKVYGFGGDDLIVCGAGDNKLWGGDGSDSFAFGWEAKGHDTIYDFRKGTDKLVLYDGIVVTGSEYVNGGTLVHFSSGGDVFLQNVKVTDYHTLF